MDKLVDDFEKSLFNSSENVISDYLEIGIDSLMNEGILKELPIVKTNRFKRKRTKRQNRGFKRCTDGYCMGKSNSLLCFLPIYNGKRS